MRKRMSDLHFPNGSRSLDKRHNRVCFWGYHKTRDVCFFVGIEALQRISNRPVIAEVEMLGIFDGELEKIHRVADRVYGSHDHCLGMSVYDLSAEDF